MFLFAAAAVTGCVPPRPTVAPASITPEPTATAPEGWTRHRLAGGVGLSLPSDWLVLDEAALADPTRRAEIERDFEGAETLFGQLAAQGRSARIVLLGVDPRARGTGTFPPVVSVVAVEPALPPVLLAIGADFAVSALENAFAIETDVGQTDVETPLGDGIRIVFGHRVVGTAGGAGTLVEHDGVLVTTGSASYLVSRSVDPVAAFADTPTLPEIAGTLTADP